MQALLETVTEVFRDILHKPSLTLKPADSPETVAGWDSLTHPELVSAIEEKFDIEFTFKELAGIKDIAYLLQLIERKTSTK